MKKNSIIAGTLSFIIPGLGQIYDGKKNRGAIILFAAIVIANLNIIILPLISVANPIVPPQAEDTRGLWAYWIPRIVHDVTSVWCITFWFWAVADAVILARKTNGYR